MSLSQSPLLRHRPQASAPPLSTPGLMRWGSERLPQAFVHVVLEPSLFPRANPDPYPGVTATATPGVVLSNSTTDAAFLQGSSCRNGSRFALRAMHGAVGVLPAAVGDADEHANQSAAVAALDDLPVAATHAHPLTACLRSVLVPLGLLVRRGTGLVPQAVLRSLQAPLSRESRAERVPQRMNAATRHACLVRQAPQAQDGMPPWSVTRRYDRPMDRWSSCSHDQAGVCACRFVRCVRGPRR